MKYRIPGIERRKGWKMAKESGRESYFYVTCQRMTKKVWDDLVKRYGLIGDNIIEGRTTIAYRRVRPMTEHEIDKANNKLY